MQVDKLFLSLQKYRATCKFASFDRFPHIWRTDSSNPILNPKRLIH